MQQYFKNPLIDQGHNNFYLNLYFITEKVTCRTDHGEYQVDETFNDNNCEKRCTCTQSGNFDCRPLVCPDGLRKKGKKSLNFTPQNLGTNPPTVFIQSTKNE